MKKIKTFKNRVAKFLRKCFECIRKYFKYMMLIIIILIFRFLIIQETNKLKYIEELMVYIDKICFFREISNLKLVNKNVFLEIINVDNLELYKTLFDFSLSFLCVTILKDSLRDYLKGKFKKYKNFKKKHFKILVLMLPVIILMMLRVAQWLGNLIGWIISIFGGLLFVPLIISAFLSCFSDSDNMEESFESYFLLLVINILGILITMLFVYIKIIPDFSFFKFFSKYFFLTFGEIFKLTDAKNKNSTNK